MDNKPNKERIRLLVDELRKTKKRQGRGVLKRKGNRRNYYCCLGIACELAKANGLELLEYEKKEYLPSNMTQNPGLYTISDFVVDRYDGSTGMLPIAVRNWFGFTNSNPSLRLPDGSVESAATANDTLRLTFPQIADAFERMYLTEETTDAS